MQLGQLRSRGTSLDDKSQFSHMLAIACELCHGAGVVSQVVHELIRDRAQLWCNLSFGKRDRVLLVKSIFVRIRNRGVFTRKKNECQKEDLGLSGGANGIIDLNGCAQSLTRRPRGAAGKGASAVHDLVVRSNKRA